LNFTRQRWTQPITFTQQPAMGYPWHMLNRITYNANQCGGRPCIRGLRIRVKDVLALLATGSSVAEILADYPYLEAEDINACLVYAASEADHPVLIANG
jgi:uncharacterized protein (DUF433 family)